MAVIEGDSSRPTWVWSDCITPAKGLPEERLAAVGQAVCAAIKTHRPDVLAVETLFFSTNKKTALAVAEARGAILAVAGAEGVTVLEFSPGTVKLAVSGCPRNCAESGIKDVGVIGVDSGWEIYVAGNGGIKTEVAQFLVKVRTHEEVLEYAGAFLQLYREEGWYLERTVHYVHRVGLDHVKKRVLEDEAGRKALHERLQFALAGVPDPWAERARGEGHGEFEALERPTPPSYLLDNIAFYATAMGHYEDELARCVERQPVGAGLPALERLGAGVAGGLEKLLQAAGFGPFPDHVARNIREQQAALRRVPHRPFRPFELAVDQQLDHGTRLDEPVERRIVTLDLAKHGMLIRHGRDGRGHGERAKHERKPARHAKNHRTFLKGLFQPHTLDAPAQRGNQRCAQGTKFQR